MLHDATWGLLDVSHNYALNPAEPWFKLMMTPKPRYSDANCSAFSLVEMVLVIAILVILIAAGIKLTHGAASQARRTGTDQLAGMIEQARNSAITCRSHVVLAVAEPGDLPTGDERCRLGMFKVESWPEHAGDPIKDAVLLKRWLSLETGVALIGGKVDGIENPLDGKQVRISYGSPKATTVTVHAIAFNPRGGLCHPPGSTPIAMRLAEGNYRDGKAFPFRRGESATIAENRLKIGRITARPYRTDG